MERLLDAPRALVFAAWTDPEHIDMWWGPNGFRNETSAMEVAAGGRWKFVMHGPDGTDWDNLVEYLEVVPPERLVYLHGTSEAHDPKRFHVTVTFTEVGGRTLLRMRSLFASKAAVEEVKRFGAVELGGQTMDRFAAYLATR